MTTVRLATFLLGSLLLAAPAAAQQKTAAPALPSAQQLDQERQAQQAQQQERQKAGALQQALVLKLGLLELENAQLTAQLQSQAETGGSSRDPKGEEDLNTKIKILAEENQKLQAENTQLKKKQTPPSPSGK